MNLSPDPKDETVNSDKNKDIKKVEKGSPEEEKQQKSDPQLTELKGFVDPAEPLEVEGTDNPV